MSPASVARSGVCATMARCEGDAPAVPFVLAFPVRRANGTRVIADYVRLNTGQSYRELATIHWAANMWLDRRTDGTASSPATQWIMRCMQLCCPCRPEQNLA
eukprot:364757-Chlamydomonas_euryale.AAC.2